jgi:hypothetical protein
MARPVMPDRAGRNDHSDAVLQATLFALRPLGGGASPASATLEAEQKSPDEEPIVVYLT